MDAWIDELPWLVAMAVLIALSAFFSASEAALFYLRNQDRRAFASGSGPQRVAAALLADPDRLLTAVLFWNLVVNLAYFAITVIVSIRLRSAERVYESGAVAFSVGSLMAIIFFSEMLPKSLAVLSAPTLASLNSIPMAVFVRILVPVMPVLRLANLLSQRLLWPRFAPERYLDVADLERVIEVSSGDAQLIEQERTALRNIVMLSDIRVEEWMRPRTQFRSFRPPVSLEELGGKLTPSGYLLVTETDSDEIVGSIDLRGLSEIPSGNLEHHAEPVVYVPWCSSVADALEEMHGRERRVTAVVNEFGETIGILTLEDVLDTVFDPHPTRSDRLLNRRAIQEVGKNAWRVTGITGLGHLARYLKTTLPPSKSVTVGGIVQETLQRLAVQGDECDWHAFHLKVLEAPQRGQMLVELTFKAEEEPQP